MKMRDRTVLAVMLLVGFTTGEASARSTCRAKLQIGGASAPGKGVMARCTDGTAARDSDGDADVPRLGGRCGRTEPRGRRRVREPRGRRCRESRGRGRAARRAG